MLCGAGLGLHPIVEALYGLRAILSHVAWCECYYCSTDRVLTTGWCLLCLPKPS